MEGLPGGPVGAGEGSGRHHRRHRGPQRSRGKDVSPTGTTGPTATPTGGSRGPSSSRSP
nr:hypothetical protein [Metallosphaera yellowstonensis]